LCTLKAQSIAPQLVSLAADDSVLRGKNPGHMSSLACKASDNVAVVVAKQVQPAAVASTAAVVAAAAGQLAEGYILCGGIVVVIALVQVVLARTLTRNCGRLAAAAVGMFAGARPVVDDWYCNTPQ